MVMLLSFIAGAVFLLLYGSINVWVLAASLAAAVAVAAGGLKSHKHGGLADIDYYAHTSPLAAWSAGLKGGGALLVMVTCLAAHSLLVCGFVLASMLALAVLAGRIPLVYYVSLLLMPAGFIVAGVLGIAVDLAPAPLPGARFSLPVWGAVYLCLTPQGQATALLVAAKALAAVSCLYMLSLTTPLPGLIAVLRRCKCPAVVIELMYLIYRYIFILARCLEQMTQAGRARLGYASRRAAWRTTRLIAASLLRSAFTRIGANYDAMLARGYNGELRFMTTESKASGREYLFWALYLGAVAALAFV